MNIKHIAVLDFNTYEITLYKAQLESENESSIEDFLLDKGHNLDEIAYMVGDEPIAINNFTGYQD